MSTPANFPSPLAGEGGGTTVTRGEGEQVLVRRARHMRRHPTDAEKKLWYALRSRRFLNWKFRRQVPLGPYVADFLCFDYPSSGSPQERLATFSLRGEGNTSENSV